MQMVKLMHVTESQTTRVVKKQKQVNLTIKIKKQINSQRPISTTQIHERNIRKIAQKRSRFQSIKKITNQQNKIDLTQVLKRKEQNVNFIKNKYKNSKKEHVNFSKRQSRYQLPPIKVKPLSELLPQSR